MVSVIILTKNEAQDLPQCLGSLGWVDDKIVLDSGSTDDTVSIAQKMGARVFTNPFKSFGEQRNWALDHCEPKHDWILFLDADEVSTPSFSAQVLLELQKARSDTAGFYCCWKMMYRGVWLKRSDSFPKWQLRIGRKGRFRYVDFGHGQKEGAVKGGLDYIREPYLHYAMSKGMRHWIERHNRYSDQEAVARAEEQVCWANLYSRHGSRRNRALKLLVSKMPGWPLARFAWPYFFRLGFLEGWSGFAYCVNLAYYEWLIQVKMRENRERARGVKI